MQALRMAQQTWFLYMFDPGRTHGALAKAKLNTVFYVKAKLNNKINFVL